MKHRFGSIDDSLPVVVWLKGEGADPASQADEAVYRKAGACRVLRSRYSHESVLQVRTMKGWKRLIEAHDSGAC